MAKKNFVSFVQEVDQNPAIGAIFQKYLDDNKGKDLKPKEIRDFFRKKGYDGVSLNDCKKLAAVRNARTKINVSKSTQGY